MNEACNSCVTRGVPCGEKLTAIHSRSSNELHNSPEFVDHLRILNVAHQHIAWTRQLSNYFGVPSSKGTAAIESVESKSQMSVEAELMSTLVNRFPTVDKDTMSWVVTQALANSEQQESNVQTGEPTDLDPIPQGPLYPRNSSSENPWNLELVEFFENSPDQVVV